MTVKASCHCGQCAFEIDDRVLLSDRGREIDIEAGLADIHRTTPDFSRQFTRLQAPHELFEIAGSRRTKLPRVVNR